MVTWDQARLHSEVGGGAWCPRSAVSGLDSAPEWIQVRPEGASMWSIYM